MIGSIITMTSVTVATTPIFIPNLDPNRHKLLCIVLKPMPVRKNGYMVLEQMNEYDVMFFGQSAEKTALVLKQGDRVNLKGHFRCGTVHYSDGHKKARATFIVSKLELLNPVTVEIEPFDYQKAFMSSRFGHARIWIKGKGFIEKSRPMAPTTLTLH